MNEATREYAKNWKARAVRRLRVMVSKEEFDVHIQRHIDCGRLSAEEVLTMLKGMDMQESESREYRALVLLRDYGELTSGQLHSMLGLGEDELPSEVLGELLSSGSVVKIGKFWRLFEEDDARLASHYMPNERQIAAWPIPVRSAAVRPAIVPRTAPIIAGPTNADKAVALLIANGGRVTTAQMVAVIKTKKRDGLNAHLRLALATGRVARDGKDWILGPASLREAA